RTLDEASDDAVLRFLHRDERGSAILTTDEAGEPSPVAVFDVLGAADGGSLDTRVGYTGKLLDREFGLLVMGVRAYDPASGMFTTPDLMRVSSLTATGVNPYAYANNDPINFRDPTGLCPQDYIDSDGTQNVHVCEVISELEESRPPWIEFSLAFGSMMAAGQLPYGAVGELVASVYVDSGTWTSEQKWAFGLGQTLAGIALGIEGLAEMGTGGGLTVVTAPAGGVGAIVG